MRPERTIGGYSFPTTGGRILLDPDGSGLGGGVATEEPTTPGSIVDSGPVENQRGNMETVEVSPPTGSNLDPETPASPQATATPVAAADPNQATDAPQWQSIRDAGQQYGYQFPAEVADDQAALAYLIRQANASKQADYYAQVGRQLAPHAPQIQEYLRQQQAPPAQAERPAWQTPEFDRRWLSLVDYDASTNLHIGKPGADPEIVRKVNQYAEWKEKFDSDPASMLQQMVDSRAKELFSEQFEQRFQAQQKQQAVASIVQKNSEWFYAKDTATGRIVPDAYGRPQPSPAGVAYLKALAEVKSMGVADPVHQDSLAQQMIQNRYYAQQAASTQARSSSAPAAPAFNPAAAAPSTNVLGAGLTPNQRAFTPGATSEPATEGLSLNEQLRRAFASNGVTDNDFASLHAD